MKKTDACYDCKLREYPEGPCVDLLKGQGMKKRSLKESLCLASAVSRR